MKRSIGGPQGQSSSPNKRPKIRTEEDFQQAFARILNVPDFPAEPPLFVAGPESLVKVPTLEAEKEIERLLGRDAQAEPMFANGTDVLNTSGIPKEFTAELRRKYQRGDFDAKVLDYYSDILPQGDSTTVPGQGGRALLLKSIMRQEDAMPSALVAGPAWRPIRPLGKGGFGEVTLWEKTRKDGPPIRIATKESRPHDFFKDYCSEAHLTRRLNDLGCKNVINVVEWAYIEDKFWRNEMGKISKSESRHRICYEYAEYGDFYDLIAWYHMKRLILPEAFLWHVFHSMANALCYCCYGTNKPSSYRRGWDSIVHMDIKGENMLLAVPDSEKYQLYPCVKLADFGLAHTIGVSVAEIRHFKSARPSGGTKEYMAPEVTDKRPELQRRTRHPHELIGSHSDVYSLGKTIKMGTDLLGIHSNLIQLKSDFKPKLEMVYTTNLWNLIDRCMKKDPRYRPRLPYIYNETKLGMEKFRTLAQAEEAEAFSKGIPGCFHSNVLFKKADRERFDTDPVFRSNYRKNNLLPVWEILGPPPSRNVDQAQPSIPLGEDQFVHVHPSDVALADVRKGQQKGGVPASVERELERKRKEKMRTAARVQQGIRGLLSKMNFFS